MCNGRGNHGKSYFLCQGTVEVWKFDHFSWDDYSIDHFSWDGYSILDMTSGNDGNIFYEQDVGWKVRNGGGFKRKRELLPSF